METLQRTANRGSISTGYDIDNSVKLEDSNNEWFFNASPTAGNRRTYTFSFWIKRTEIGLVNASGNAYVIGAGQHGRMFFGGDTFQFRFDDGHVCRNITATFRDTSAWYHFVVAVDTNQLSSSNRVKLYVNGESLAVDDHDGGSFPDLQDQGAFFSTNYLTIGTAPFGGSYNAGDGDYDMSGYLAEFCAVDGQQLAPTDFGEFDSDSGIWKPINVSGINFGSEGYYLDFADAADLGDDESGNGNDFTENNVAAADQATDTPTNNFCTWNVNYNYTNSNGNPTITEGATKTAEGAGGWTQAKATMGVTSGKWYWEYKMGGSISWMGVQDDAASQTALAGQYTLFLYNGDTTVEINDSGSLRDDTVLSYTFSTSDIYAVALNMDDNEISYYQNGSIIGSAISLDGLADRLLLPYIGTNSSTNETNFGGYTTFTISSAATDANGYGTFEYAPPSGYYALCTKNLAEYG